MYSKSIIISISVMIICSEAGIITSAFDSKLETFISDSNQKLQKNDKLSKLPKKYTDVSHTLGEYKKVYENTGKSSSVNKSWIENNIPRIISDSEVSKKVIQIKVFDSDVLHSEGKNINKTLHVATVVDKINNQQPNNDSVVEYLELGIYPNIIDEKLRLSTKDYHHVTDSDEQTHIKRNSNNTDVVFDVEYIDNETENIKDIEEKIVTPQNKTEIISDEGNISINITIPIKYDDKNVSVEQENDFDEFIFINNVYDIPEFVTEINFDNFEINADLLIEEPRFKRAVNIIEEENLLTTVSGLQYTGRHKILNNDLSYKNINS